MAKNVIWAGPADGSNCSPMTVEGEAAAALIPGSLADIAAEQIAYSNADGTAPVNVLIVREVGEQFGKTITDPWTAGENSITVQPRSGEFVNVRLAASQNVAFGAALTSNGDGTFKVAGAADHPMLYAREAVVTAAGVTSTLVRAVKQ